MFCNMTLKKVFLNYLGSKEELYGSFGGLHQEMQGAL